MGQVSKSEFLRSFSKALSQNRAALFVGAGLSVGAGFVDWRGLLREVAADLGLDIDEEHDLIALAQYEANRKGTRDRLDREIVEKFAEEGQLSRNHRLLARLPLDTVWTTNYDRLLEHAFVEANKRPDVKVETGDLKRRVHYADVVVFKMHGDVGRPSEAVVTKDDYERFELTRSAFTDQLRADLLSRQFLFLGFSFTDPNIEYTFNRLRRIIDPSGTPATEHFCVLRAPDGHHGDADRLARERKRLEHRIADLSRFGVQALVIDDYGEITDLLLALNRRVNTRNVLISGAAHDFDPFGRERLEGFCRRLGAALIRAECNVVSGFGLGVGGPVVLGAHEEVLRSRTSRIGQRLRLYPFPQGFESNREREAFQTNNRREMVAASGAAVFIAGNKYDPKAGTIVPSGGTREEFEMIREAGGLCIPIAATGHVAANLHREMSGDVPSFFPGIDVSQEFALLADMNATDDELIRSVLAILDKARHQLPG